jgi:hypothetical protein
MFKMEVRSISDSWGVILVLMVNIESDLDQFKTDYTSPYRFDHLHLLDN